MSAPDHQHSVTVHARTNVHTRSLCTKAENLIIPSSRTTWAAVRECHLDLLSRGHFQALAARPKAMSRMQVLTLSTDIYAPWSVITYVAERPETQSKISPAIELKEAPFLAQ